MPVTVRQVADWLLGDIVGDETLPIHAARTLQDAQANDITFVEDDKHLPRVAKSQANVLITSAQQPPIEGKTLIRVRDPLGAFIEVYRRLNGVPEEPPVEIHPTAVIHPTAQIGQEVRIDPYAVIGEGAIIGNGCRIHAGVSVGRFCRLGEQVTLYPHVVLYDGCILGNRVIIHANAVIGADGFGYRTQRGRHVKVPQLGHVEIADDVEIGACTTIDRGTFQATQIGEGTKIDNLVMIGHNCRIGRHNLFVSQVGIAGSCTTGDYVVMAGQVGIADHCHIGDRTQLGAKCGVHKDIPADQRMLGAPATPDREQMRILMSLEKLPEIRRDILRIKRILGLDDTSSKREAS